jgi:hypothetical protein
MNRPTHEISDTPPNGEPWLPNGAQWSPNRGLWYQQYSVFVYVIDFLVWFTCCAGTGKRMKSFVDYAVDT